MGVRVRGGRAMCAFRGTLRIAYIRVGYFRALERSCASMAHDFYVQKRHCGFSVYVCTQGEGWSGIAAAPLSGERLRVSL